MHFFLGTLRVKVIRPQIKVGIYKLFSIFFITKTYVVGTQKNCHNETILLSIQNTHLNRLVRKYCCLFVSLEFLNRNKC